MRIAVEQEIALVKPTSPWQFNPVKSFTHPSSKLKIQGFLSAWPCDVFPLQDGTYSTNIFNKQNMFNNFIVRQPQPLLLLCHFQYSVHVLSPYCTNRSDLDSPSHRIPSLPNVTIIIIAVFHFICRQWISLNMMVVKTVRSFCVLKITKKIF